MATQPITEQIPIRLDKYGQYRVGNTNILLDLVVLAYRQGRTPESIIESYPTLSLDDIYFAIGYYIRHRDEIDAYMQQQKTKAIAGEIEDKKRFPKQTTRDMLLDRLKNRQGR